MSKTKNPDVSAISQQIIAEVRRQMQSEQAAQNNFSCDRSAPHVVYGAKIIQAKQGWFCILGDIRTGVIGFGQTPQEACAEFDQIWQQGY